MDLTDLLNQTSAGNLVFTGICDPNRVQAVYNSLTPDQASAVGTLVQCQNPMPDYMDYRFEMRGEEAAKNEYSDASIDVLYIGNNEIAKSGQSLVDAWLPKIKPGGHIICFDHYSQIDETVTKVNSNTTEYTKNWYLIKE